MADDVLTDRRSQILLLSVAAVALFLDGLDGTIVNVVLPDMAGDFGTDTSATSWVVTAYYVMMAGLILIFGKVCDAGALKRVFTVGLVVFAVGSLASGSPRPCRSCSCPGWSRASAPPCLRPRRSWSG